MSTAVGFRRAYLQGSFFFSNFGIVMKARESRWPGVALLLLWAAACFVFFQWFYRYHLFFNEQNHLFTFTTSQLLGYFDKPAWLACLAGDFLTQFFYYAYAGPAVLTLALMGTALLARAAARRLGLAPSVSTVLALVLATVEAVTFFDAGHELSSLVALALGIAAFIATSMVWNHNHWWPAIFYPIAAGATYWMAGYGVWVLMALWVADVICHKHKNRYYLMAWMLALAVTAFEVWVVAEKCYLRLDDALAWPGVGRLSKPDFDLEADLEADNNYYFGRYDRIVATVQRTEHPTPLQTLFYNMVMARQGRLPDVLLSTQPTELGTLYTVGPTTPKLIINTMPELYWTVGDMMYAERAALLASTFSPHNHNARMLKRMVEVNLVTTDTLAACKYLNILSNTLAYRRWAVAHHPATMTPAVREEIEAKRTMVNKQDTLRIGDHARTILRELVRSNPDNIVALDYLLCTDLQIADLPSFKADYDALCMANGKPRLKPLYQQALCICLAVEQADLDTWQRYIKLTEVRHAWKNYNDNPANPMFAGSYWRYYDAAMKQSQ